MSSPKPSSEPDTESDRRQAERAPIKIPIDYSAVDVFFAEFSSNINEGGMFIETDHPGELDEIVQLQMRFPELPGPVQVGGRIAWLSDGKDGSPAGMGIAFLDLTDKARETINDIVRMLRRKD